MTFRSIVLAVSTTLIMASMARAQAGDAKPPASEPQSESLEKSSPEAERRAGHLEFLDDPYIAVPRGDQQRSPGGRYVRGQYVSIQVNVDGNNNNIIGDAGNEPSIAVDPTAPHRMCIGWRQFDTISNNFRQAGWGYTADAGQTWTFPGVIEPGVFRSDPVVDSDAAGIFYYNSLTNEGGYQCKVFKSFNGGATWDAGTFAYGGDKQWQEIDRTNGPGAGHIYASWNETYSICSGHFTRSTNGGLSFESCTVAPGSPYWGTLAVGPAGELYLCGGGFIVDKSVNAKFAGQSISWTSASVDLGGSIEGWGGPNPSGLLGQAWVAVDHSGGPTSGNVYLLCSVDPPGADPMDVMFSRSTNGGATWSPPVRVNDDPTGNGAWQWFGTMSVAPNGRIDVIWNDTRNDPGGYDSEVHYSYSTDAGVTWSSNEALTPAFDPHIGWPQQNKIGDYYDMTSDDRGANLAFSATFNGEQDVYYLRIGDPYCTDDGGVTLDRGSYACEGVVNIEVLDCGLNTDDGIVENVTVDIDSDSEAGVEQVILIENGPASALFEGSIGISQSNSPGILLAAEGDTLTVTYIDADDGQGGNNVPVTATAIVDCAAPNVSNVQAVNIEPHTATVTFDSDEPALGTVHYGLSCGSLPWTATGNGYATSAEVYLSGLQDETTYFFSIEAEDEAGNAVSDDNGGNCYLFTTPDIPSFFTEEFGSDNDLDNLSLIFSPNGSVDHYAGCVEQITELPVDPAGGTPITLSDDSSANVTLSGGETVYLYDGSYNHFYVGSNGYITFTTGDSDYTETLGDHFGMPRISALFDDLNPSSGGTVSWRQLVDRAVVTYSGVYEYGATDPNTFQVEMHFDGTIVISYLTIYVADGLAGLSEGIGVSPDFYETDLSGMGDCGPQPPVAEGVSAATAVAAPVTIALPATDDGLPESPGQLAYIITALPAHGSLTDPGADAIGYVPYELVSYGNQVIYQPEPDYRPADSFLFKANDGGIPPGGGDSNVAQVSVDIGGAAWDPVAYNMALSVGATAPTDIELTASDPNGDPLTYTIEDLPAAGSGLLFDPAAGRIDAAPYTLANGGRVVSFVPPFGQALSTSFTFSAEDATAGSNIATVSLTIGSSVPVLVYDYPMDTDPGWSTEGMWAFGQPVGGGSHGRDPASGYTGDNVCGYNLFGDYANNMATPLYLTTTAIDCSVLSQVELRFGRWLGVERPPYDHASIEVSADGQGWTTLWENGPGSLSETSWSSQALDISAVADGEAAVYLRWGMGPTDGSASYPGWNLDDVEIWAVVNFTCDGVTPGDVNFDLNVNGLDLAAFVDVLIDPYAQSVTPGEFCAADIDRDGFVTVDDVDGLISILLPS